MCVSVTCFVRKRDDGEWLTHSPLASSESAASVLLRSRQHGGKHLGREKEREKWREEVRQRSEGREEASRSGRSRVSQAPTLETSVPVTA